MDKYLELMVVIVAWGVLPLGILAYNYSKTHTENYNFSNKCIKAGGKMVAENENGLICVKEVIKIKLDNDR